MHITKHLLSELATGQQEVGHYKCSSGVKPQTDHDNSCWQSVQELNCTQLLMPNPSDTGSGHVYRPLSLIDFIGVSLSSIQCEEN